MNQIPTGLRLLIVLSPLRHEGKRVAAGVPLLLAYEPARAALVSEAARFADDDEIAAYEAALPSPTVDGAPPSSLPLDRGLSVVVSDRTATGDATATSDTSTTGDASAAGDASATGDASAAGDTSTTGDASTTAAAPVKPAAKSAAKKR